MQNQNVSLCSQIYTEGIYLILHNKNAFAKRI